MTGAPLGAALRHHLTAGWAVALARGALAFGAVLALAAAVTVFLAAGPRSAGEAVRQGALVPALVHRVPIEAGPITMRLALLLATVGAGWLLVLGGRAVAGRTGGGAALRALHGSKVAVPYAGASLIVSLVALGTSAGPFRSVVETPGYSVAPSVPGSLLWPFLLAAACGAVGGMAGTTPGGERERRLRAVLAGGWRATWLSVVLGTAAFLVVLALHPQVVRDHVDAAFRRGPAAGTVAVTGATLLLPNAGTGVAAASMGGGIELQALGVSCPVISYTRFPEETETSMGPCGRLPFRVAPTPRGYLSFLVLPALATIAGGWLAARRARAASGREGAIWGTSAGLAFAMLFALACVASRLTYQVTGAVAAVVGDVRVAVGPDPVTGFALALLWGLAGGAAGGWWGVRRRRARVSPGPVRRTEGQTAGGGGGGGPTRLSVNRMYAP